MARTVLGSYGRAVHRSIGPPWGRCVFFFVSNPCTLSVIPRTLKKAVVAEGAVATAAASVNPNPIPVKPIQGYLAYEKQHPPGTLQ